MPVVTPVMREYLETIYNLNVEGDPVVGARLAEKFGVSQPNVAEVLRRMQSNGLVRMPGRGRGRPGEGIELTPEGRTQAETLLRQHRLAERFLVDVMGMDWVEAHEEAHNLERGMSPALEERMMKTLGNPRTCPHGNPIPTATMNTLEYLREQHAMRLSDAAVGLPTKVVLISEVVEDETALLNALGQMQIMPGAYITVIQRNPSDGSLQAQVIPRAKTGGQQRTPEEAALRVELNKDLAAKIWVNKAEKA